jgi:cysteine dioxygenase
MIAGTPCEPAVPLALRQLFESLDQYEERIPLDVLERTLRGLELKRSELENLCCFDPCAYQRNRLHRGPAYEALLMCWSSGQASPIHDHAGSSCAFRILDGTASETIFSLTDQGAVTPTAASCFSTGYVCAAEDADIHRVTNEQSCELVTLHIYSPSLASMKFYDG